MSLILNIDTSVQTASFCFARNGEEIAFAENKSMKDHSSWLHNAIEGIMKDKKIDFTELNAVAVTIGPGSYTGLRIGLSIAKGFCFALKIPLLAIGTLEMMAHAAISEPVELLCPMIDARRQEVFTALFDNELNVVLKPKAMVLDESSFNSILSENKILFFGNGSKKFQQMMRHENAMFKEITINASHLATLSYEKFKNNEFADLAYTEPLYLKEFHVKNT